jgi:hypothetical protein
MADPHEAQLLNDLLGVIAREDAGLGAPHLASRVLDSAVVDARDTAGERTRVRHWAAAAGIAAAALVAAFLWTDRAVVTPAGPTAAVRATEAVVSEKTTRVALDPKPASRAVRDMARPTEPPSQANDTLGEPPIAESPIAHSPEGFLPLMPITEEELTGSFQIVRVQMPRSALGALRSPLEQPNELVEADVLLGEDGMARAIRVSTSGSVYPWRSR